MKKISKIDLAIIVSIYLMVCLLGFFGLQRTVNKIIIIAILLRLFTRYGRSLLRNKFFIMGTTIILILVLFSIASNGLTNFINIGCSNMLMLLYSMIYVLYFYLLCKSNGETIERLYEKSFLIINITMLINCLAVIYQVNHPGQLIARNITSYTAAVIQGMISVGDTASGFFEWSGVHTLCIFSVFVIIYDLTFLNRSKRKNKTAIIVYIIFISLLNLAIALLNDNKAFFILLPISLIIYYLISADLTKKSVKRTFTIITILMFVVIILPFSNFSFVKSIVDTVSKVTDFSRIAIHTGVGNGSNERIAIPVYAIRQLSTWFLGVGISKSGFYQAGFLGFNHFGQSDFGTLLIFSGIWMTLIMISYFIKLYEKIIMPINFKRKKSLIFYITLLYVLMSVFTQIITNFSNQICFIYLILALRARYINVQSNKEIS